MPVAVAVTATILPRISSGVHPSPLPSRHLHHIVQDLAIIPAPIAVAITAPRPISPDTALVACRRRHHRYHNGTILPRISNWVPPSPSPSRHRHHIVQDLAIILAPIAVTITAPRPISSDTALVACRRHRHRTVIAPNFIRHRSVCLSPSLAPLCYHFFFL